MEGKDKNSIRKYDIDRRQHLFDKLEVMFGEDHFLESLTKKCLDPHPKFRPRNIDELLERETIIDKGDVQDRVEIMIKLQEFQV